MRYPKHGLRRFHLRAACGLTRDASDRQQKITVCQQEGVCRRGSSQLKEIEEGRERKCKLTRLPTHRANAATEYVAIRPVHRDSKSEL